MRNSDIDLSLVSFEDSCKNNPYITRFEDDLSILLIKYSKNKTALFKKINAQCLIHLEKNSSYFKQKGIYDALFKALSDTQMTLQLSKSYKLLFETFSEIFITLVDKFEDEIVFFEDKIKNISKNFSLALSQSSQKKFEAIIDSIINNLDFSQKSWFSPEEEFIKNISQEKINLLSIKKSSIDDKVIRELEFIQNSLAKIIQTYIAQLLEMKEKIFQRYPKHVMDLRIDNFFSEKNRGRLSEKEEIYTNNFGISDSLYSEEWTKNYYQNQYHLDLKKFYELDEASSVIKSFRANNLPVMSGASGTLSYVLPGIKFLLNLELTDKEWKDFISILSADMVAHGFHSFGECMMITCLFHNSEMKFPFKSPKIMYSLLIPDECKKSPDYLYLIRKYPDFFPKQEVQKVKFELFLQEIIHKINSHKKEIQEILTNNKNIVNVFHKTEMTQKTLLKNIEILSKISSNKNSPLAIQAKSTLVDNIILLRSLYQLDKPELEDLKRIERMNFSKPEIIKRKESFNINKTLKFNIEIFEKLIIEKKELLEKLSDFKNFFSDKGWNREKQEKIKVLNNYLTKCDYPPFIFNITGYNFFQKRNLDEIAANNNVISTEENEELGISTQI